MLNVNILFIFSPNIIINNGEEKNKNKKWRRNTEIYTRKKE